MDLDDGAFDGELAALFFEQPRAFHQLALIDFPLILRLVALKLVVCEIAAKLLYDQFGYNPGAQIDALIQRRYDEAISWLVQVRDKVIEPQYADSAGEDVGTIGVPRVHSSEVRGWTNRGGQTVRGGGVF